MSVPAVATGRTPGPQGTAAQRVRAAAVAGLSRLASRLPERGLARVAAVIGWGWYRLTPGRAVQARQNLARVAGYLATASLSAGPGDRPADSVVRAAAADPRALEMLVRRAYAHAVRYYMDMVRVPAVGDRILRERLVIETPEVVERALASTRPVIFVGLHFGAIELPALYLARKTGRITTVPMETLRDPALQAWIIRTRSQVGLRIVGLAEARRELRAALERGESVGLIGDRDLTGNGILTPFFGVPARLPAGPALLAIESGAPVFVVAVRRAPDGTWRGQVREVPLPPDGPRRDRVVTLLEGIAQAFEASVAVAPEQWWTVFHPIWSDLPGSLP
jgi:KDO2-lipid IV(A) lauroyltransferase